MFASYISDELDSQNIERDRMVQKLKRQIPC